MSSRFIIQEDLSPVGGFSGDKIYFVHDTCRSEPENLIGWFSEDHRLQGKQAKKMAEDYVKELNEMEQL